MKKISSIFIIAITIFIACKKNSIESSNVNLTLETIKIPKKKADKPNPDTTNGLQIPNEKADGQVNNTLPDMQKIYDKKINIEEEYTIKDVFYCPIKIFLPKGIYLTFFIKDNDKLQTPKKSFPELILDIYQHTTNSNLKATKIEDLGLSQDYNIYYIPEPWSVVFNEKNKFSKPEYKVSPDQLCKYSEIFKLVSHTKTPIEILNEIPETEHDKILNLALVTNEIAASGFSLKLDVPSNTNFAFHQKIV